MTALLDHLTREYGQPSHPTKRPEDDTIGSGARQFKIDDESTDDQYAGFCRIWAILSNAESDTFTIRLENAPHNGDVTDLVNEHGGEVTMSPTGATISIPLHTDDARFVRGLAKAIRRTTARGRRYADSNWKWISRRAADGLERFATLLAAANRQAQTTASTRQV